MSKLDRNISFEGDGYYRFREKDWGQGENKQQ